jgi:hypothetical protein
MQEESSMGRDSFTHAPVYNAVFGKKGFRKGGSDLMQFFL